MVSTYFDFLMSKCIRCLTIIVLVGSTTTAFSKNLELNKSKPKTIEKKWELRTAPIAMMVSWYTLDVSYRLSENLATGPAVISYNARGPGGMFGPTYNGYAIGWNGSYYFSSLLKDTWYISAHAYYESYKSYPRAYLGHYVYEGGKANTAIGYQWRGAMINIIAGLGLEYRSYSVTDKKDPIGGIEQPSVDSSESRGLPFVEFKIGIEI